MALTLPLLTLMVSLFIGYLLRCYVEEWRMRQRLLRRLARARARAAASSMPAMGACARPATDCKDLAMAEAA